LDIFVSKAYFFPRSLGFDLFFEGGDFLEEKRGKMTVQEAGRKGGLKTL
jgi:hypothetical protein